MNCRQTWLTWIVMAIILNLAGFAHAQNDVLPDAPKQIRFYANQLKSNFEKIKTLKGELSSSFRRPVTAAVFYHNRENPSGVEEVRVPGDFIQENTEVYTFTWDLTSNNLVSIGVPNDKPCRYLDAKTNEELIPERKDTRIGVERKTVIHSKFAITTSRVKRTAGGQAQVYERTQNNVHKMRGSPTTVFFGDGDLTYHEFLFAAAKQLEEEGESVGVCYLSIEKDLHILKLIANSKSGDLLSYKWTFDASRNFVLTSYESKIGELNIVTTHEWTYSTSDPERPFPTQLIRTSVLNDKESMQAIHKLSKLVVNEELADDTFSLSSLRPKNGDVLIDKESQKTIVIQNLGKDLDSTNLRK